MFASHIYKNSGVVSDPNFNNVSLLLHGDGTNGAQNNTFLDSSTNNFTITRNGTPTQGSLSPFSLNGEYSITANGGSGYFDGSGDYLDAPSNVAFQFGTAPFTIELWVYFNLYKITGLIDFRNNVANSITPVLYTTSDGGLRYFVNGADRIVSSSNLPLNSWVHIALSKSGTETKMFVNGIQSGSTYTDNNNYILSPCRIGSVNNGTLQDSIDYSMNGYISNVRVVKGTALYTSNFTPPTSPLTAVANTSLLCNFTNAGIFDNAAKNNLLTVGTARVSTAEKKFGTGSMLFNGSTDYLSTINKQDLSLGSGNFTIECWVYANSIGSFNGVFAQWPNNGGSVNNSFILESVASNMQFYWCAGSTLFGPATLGTIATGSWIYYSICRSGNTLYPFKNGILGTTVSITQTLNSPTSNITVGGLVAGSGYWDGYIDDLRITKGVARYTANFTPPTQAFPNL